MAQSLTCSCNAFDEADDFDALQFKQHAVDRVVGLEDFVGCAAGAEVPSKLSNRCGFLLARSFIRCRPVGDACLGTGVKKVDALGVQVFGEEQFVNQTVKEAFVFGRGNSVDDAINNFFNTAFLLG